MRKCNASVPLSRTLLLVGGTFALLKVVEYSLFPILTLWRQPPKLKDKLCTVHANSREIFTGIFRSRVSWVQARVDHGFGRTP